MRHLRRSGRIKQAQPTQLETKGITMHRHVTRIVRRLSCFQVSQKQSGRQARRGFRSAVAAALMLSLPACGDAPQAALEIDAFGRAQHAQSAPSGARTDRFERLLDNCISMANKSSQLLYERTPLNDAWHLRGKPNRRFDPDGEELVVDIEVSVTKAHRTVRAAETVELDAQPVQATHLYPAVLQQMLQTNCDALATTYTTDATPGHDHTGYLQDDATQVGIDGLMPFRYPIMEQTCVIVRKPLDICLDPATAIDACDFDAAEDDEIVTERVRCSAAVNELRTCASESRSSDDWQSIAACVERSFMALTQP